MQHLSGFIFRTWLQNDLLFDVDDKHMRKNKAAARH